MKATHFMALALALTLVGVPTLALSADLNAPSESFKALSHVTSTDETSPAPLTDQELAQVEGGVSELTPILSRGLYVLALEQLFEGNLPGTVPLLLAIAFLSGAEQQ